jgi:L-cystine uptake protein TcyP (sodium:dicarboxylate symporter family)
VIAVLANITVFALALGWLASRSRQGRSFSSTVLMAVGVGVFLGSLAQVVYGLGSPAITRTTSWIAVVSGVYVRLLQMVVVPLVFVSILAAVTRLSDARALGSIAAGVLGVLLVTTAIAASVGFAMAHVFGLRADGLVRGARELAGGTMMEQRLKDLPPLDLPSLLQSFVPTNIVSDLAGARSTSVIGVVVFATLLGLALLALRRDTPEVAERILRGVDALQLLVLRLVRMVIHLTPYGVVALMTHVAATSNVGDVMLLGRFVVASYVGLAALALVHAAALAAVGLSPVRFFRKVWPVLTFAFSSRSSAATIPLAVETQVSALGVPPAIASFASSFGATIGQNACAGLYPAMLAVMIAPSVGIDAATLPFFTSLVTVATLGSIGIAGVGGGATFAAIVVLSALDLPVALAGLLISVEPLIDMGRTAINVSGSMTAGAVTGRLLGRIDHALFDAEAAPL